MKPSFPLRRAGPVLSSLVPVTLSYRDEYYHIAGMVARTGGSGDQGQPRLHWETVSTK